MFVVGGCLSWAASLGCTSEAPERTADDCAQLTFTAELPGDTQEGYACFAFEAPPTRPLRSLVWRLASGSGVALHHATLYTTSEALPRGVAFDCDPMPVDAQGVHVWVPGSDALELPDDTGIVLRPDTRSLIVEAHMFRASEAPPQASQVSLCSSSEAPARLAGRFALGAPVPAIRPRTVESSSALCRFGSDLHLLSSWPHMHRMGKEFHSALLRGGERIPILDLTRWDFARQLTYATEVDVQAGDLIETTCTWQNDTDRYVLPGLFSDNEMCTHGLTAWPANAAYCDPQ
ncbi:MAG TPA: hypothetical protein VHP33_01705 [Polyangiaceae bacterium]|nr:hypothetical protein [Polyangiaceae bacterium]